MRMVQVVQGERGQDGGGTGMGLLLWDRSWTLGEWETMAREGQGLEMKDISQLKEKR